MGMVIWLKRRKDIAGFPYFKESKFVLKAVRIGLEFFFTEVHKKIARIT